MKYAKIVRGDRLGEVGIVKHQDRQGKTLTVEFEDGTEMLVSMNYVLVTNYRPGTGTSRMFNQ